MNLLENVQQAGTAAPPGVFKAYYELTKPRLSLLSVFTGIVGYLTAVTAIDWLLLSAVAIGTALAAASAAVLNEWMERDIDARMPRTRVRPLPSAHVGERTVLVYGLLLGTGGCLFLQATVNGLAAFLALATLVIYLLIYTPLKTKSPWCTEVGAIAGALPPLIGWAAAEGTISTGGWVLFGILFTWQMPHFMAIAWRFREDYRQAGLPMLSVVDPSGDRSALRSLVYTLLLIILSLVWWVIGASTLMYGIAATGLGIYLLNEALRFAKESERDVAARGLFRASILYLPLLMGILVVDRFLFS